MDDPILDMKDAIEKATHYVCGVSDLDCLLPDEIKKEFQRLFYLDFPSGGGRTDAWRMFYNGKTPGQFLERFGIDIEKPTVRDAVAFDLIKLDDETVSNGVDYVYPEHVGYSPMEYERWLLNRNFRLNLQGMDNNWTSIQYHGTSGSDEVVSDVSLELDSEITKVKVQREIDVAFFGPRISDTILDYFSQVMDAAFDAETGDLNGDFDPNQIYVPFTNANDFQIEFQLIPNTHPDCPAITTRAYYDREYSRYFGTFLERGFNYISTYAVVDPSMDKTHTGDFLVKIQRRTTDGKYQYLVARVDVDGQVKDVDDENRFRVWKSDRNEILSVCEQDFFPKSPTSPSSTEMTWEPKTGDVSLVHSTTSSRYSVFDQTIPDHELKDVRNYIQFKNRLQGMELFLKIIGRCIYRKEVRISECFINQTFVLNGLVQEFARKKDLMMLVKEWYELMAEWDTIIVKKYQIGGVRDEKKKLLQKLLEEYGSLSSKELDRKIELGRNIRSLKLEIGKVLESSILQIEERIGEIRARADEINENIAALNMTDEQKLQGMEEQFRELSREVEKDEEGKPKEGTLFYDAVEKFNNRAQEVKDGFGDDLESDQQEVDAWGSSTQQEIQEDVESHFDGINDDMQDIDVNPEYRDSTDKPSLANVDTTMLEKYAHHSDKWLRFKFNLGFELMQLKEMQVKCDDATIMVRRLVNNFKERMEDVESQIWDSNHKPKEDFSFTGISSAGLKDIILLHDWYACNAPGKTYEDMGFKDDDEFMDFRRECNKISYNLRKNQYAQSLAMRGEILDRRIKELKDALDGSGDLKWKDKYGKPEETEKGNSREVEASGFDIRKIKAFVDVEDSLVSRAKREPTHEKHGGLGLKVVPLADAGATEIEQRKREYNLDVELVMQRTFDWLKKIGLVDKMEDVDRLVALNKSSRDCGVVGKLDELEKIKNQLDSETEKMLKFRNQMQAILDRILDIDAKIDEYSSMSREMQRMGARMKQSPERNRIFMDKMDCDGKIIQLKQLRNEIKKKRSTDFSILQALKDNVDELKAKYDNLLSEFKTKIGLDSSAIENLMLGIYNRFQDEILEGDK